MLADRLAETGELAGTDVLYASVLPRAIETARLLAPALAGRDADGGDRAALEPVNECGLCELHPGEADGLDLGGVHRPVRQSGLGHRSGPAHRPRRRELDRLRQPGGGHAGHAWPPATPASWSWWPATPG